MQFMKIIYLDQNQWVKLARAWYRQEATYDLILKIKEKIKSGDLKIVLSFVNVQEALKQRNEKRRKELINFMLDLSQGYTISPYREWIKNIEIRNAFARKVNIPEVENYVFGRGFSGLFGAKETIQGDIPEKVKKEMLEKADSLDSMRLVLTTPETAARHYSLEPDKDLLDKIENARKSERSIHPNSEVVNKYVMARFMVDFIIPELIKFTLENNLPKNAILDFGDKPEDKKDELIKLFQDMPSLYCFFCLDDRRNREMHRKIQENDLNDIFSFAMAIPYCDVVVGEKMFCAIAKQCKLDVLYNTKILSSIEELNGAI